MIECDYLSNKFKLQIWEDFSATLLNKKTVQQYAFLVADICNFCQRDFLELDSENVSSYFNFLMEKYKDGIHTENTLFVKRAQLHSMSNYIIKHASYLGVEEYVFNPFVNLKIPETDVIIGKQDIPSPEQLNEILANALNDSRLFVAISLVLRCGLTTGELVEIKMKHFFCDSANHFGLTIGNHEHKRFVKIPNDVMDIVRQHSFSFEPDSYLLQNHKHEKMSYRYLNRLYHKNVKNSLFNLSDIRKAAITYMLVGGASPGDVAVYTGTSPTWMFRYNKVVSEISCAPCDYSMLRIVSK